MIQYKSADRVLPGYLYRPAGTGPFPAVLWNHGSEKDPRAQPELARFYTQNDYSVGPSQILAPILKAKGAPNHSTIYPAFGSSNQHGHGAFACWSLGIKQWGDEVLQFITESVHDK